MTNKFLFTYILKNFIRQQNEQFDINKMTANDWEDLMKFSMKHSVLPIIYDWAWKEPSYQELPEEMKVYYKKISKKIIIGQMITTRNFLELYKKINEEGLKVLVIKGIILRELYPNPDYRASGDEDLLIRKCDFKKVDELFKKEGLVRNNLENPEEQHEITYYHPSKGLRIELHLSLFPEGSKEYGQLNQYFQNVFDDAVQEEIQKVNIWTLDETHHMLYLFCHGLKHFLHSGFGIRQLCDMVVFAEKYGEKIHWNEMIKIAKKENMYVFIMNLLDIGERYLGFSWERSKLKKPTNIVLDSEQLLDDILDAGIYGKDDLERLHSSTITLQAVNNKDGKKRVSQSLFPDYEYMCRQYPYLERYKILLPYAWGCRIIDYVRKTDRKTVKDTLNIGNKRVELLKKYNII